ncbi:hypothetical protein K504DRAFT_504969 [Pleomassaria siparia CBS 279.74]|uniref:Uncharacterized protein n=1 Tax=Pleomassaria siparia CBS 279.74 TaxID=1314801 RepID=A0A6G1K1Z0_9PLEO|nr:hypothetical protein K504DRAFT_504969 [Pleomassaria siparia CBS 279.74]
MQSRASERLTEPAVGGPEWQRLRMEVGRGDGESIPQCRQQQQQQQSTSHQIPALQVSDTESIIMYSRSPSPYLGYVSTPASSSSSSSTSQTFTVVDTESPFIDHPWMPPVSSPASSPAPAPFPSPCSPSGTMDGVNLAPQSFTFNPDSTWRGTNYTSRLMTTYHTSPEDTLPTNDITVDAEQSLGTPESTWGSDPYVVHPSARFVPYPLIDTDIFAYITAL